VNDKRVDETTGERKRFASAFPPFWCRGSPKISAVLPLLYPHGLSSGDFVPAPGQFLRISAGLSPATVTRLTREWQADHTAFGECDLIGSDYVYVWADGIHLRIHLRVRLAEAKSGVRKALQEICDAEDREHAVKAVAAFEKAYGTK
jgi:putative transposase